MSAGGAVAQLVDAGPVNPDTPLRLADAVRIAFPFGGMTVSGLRRERDAGRLVMERIAGKDFVTLRAIEEMRRLCLDRRKAPDCGSNPKSGTVAESSCDDPHGSFATAGAKFALDALKRTAKELSEPSPNTSAQSIAPRESAAVIPLRS